MKDPFLEIHTLLKEKDFSRALDIVYNSERGVIREPYRNDENHAWYIVGDIFYKKEKYDLAIHAFKNSIEARKEDIQAICALANCYFCIGDIEKAAFYLKEGLQMAPKNASLTYNYGNALFDLERYKEAIRIYKKISKDEEYIYQLAQRNIRKAERHLASK
ncbi:tetratricopeptide repeat protein [Pseudomonas sp. Marseille-Q8238]